MKSQTQLEEIGGNRDGKREERGAQRDTAREQRAGKQLFDPGTRQKREARLVTRRHTRDERSGIVADKKMGEVRREDTQKIEENCIHEQRTTSNTHNGYDNINLEPNAMNNIDTVAHMNMHYTQY